MIEISDKESKTCHGTGALMNKSEGLIVLKQGCRSLFVSLLIFSASLAIFQGRAY